MKIKGVIESAEEREKRDPPSETGLARAGDAMIGAKPEGATGVGREVKGGEARCPNRPAAAPYDGHQFSPRQQKTATARQTRGERPTPPTECHAPVTHSPTSVIGWMAQEHEPNSADRRFAAIRLSKDSITRWPDHPISRSLAPAGTHSPISVIGGFDARDEANSVARDKRLDPSPACGPKPKLFTVSRCPFGGRRPVPPPDRMHRDGGPPSSATADLRPLGEGYEFSPWADEAIARSPDQPIASPRRPTLPRFGYRRPQVRR